MIETSEYYGGKYPSPPEQDEKVELPTDYWQEEIDRENEVLFNE